jgi:hypothetical protein
MNLFGGDVQKLLGILVFVLVYAGIVTYIFTGLDDAAAATGADPSQASFNTITKIGIALLPLAIVFGGAVASRSRRRRR